MEQQKKFKCVYKFRHNQTITGYRLMNKCGYVIDVNADDLKNAIANNNLEVVNIKLTSNNRLIETNKVKKKDSANKMLTRMRLIGAKEIETYCGHKIYLTDNIIYIPEDVSEINHTASNDSIEYGDFEFTDVDLFKLKWNFFITVDNLKVIGGKNLNYGSALFKNIDVGTLDLSQLETRNMINIQEIFAGARVKSINFSKFNTNNVRNMSKMFYHGEIKEIDLSSFDTSKVIDMSFMFYYCRSRIIKLSNFNTKSVENFNSMFNCCVVKELDLTSFDISDYADTTDMFYECSAYSIKVKSNNKRLISQLKNDNYKGKIIEV